MKKDTLLLICLPIIFLIPYKLLGQEFGNLLVLLLGIIYILIYIKEIKVNKFYISTLSFLLITAFLSLVFSENYIKTLGGIFIYLTILIFYIIFSSSNLELEKIIKWIIYPVIIASNLFIIYQGIVYKSRIDGNIGYANTYALILLVCLCLLSIIENDINIYFKDYLEFAAIFSIIYTGSRTTIVYLFIFIVVQTIIQLKNKKSVSYIFNLISALVTYITLTYFGFGMLFIFPIVLFSVYYFTYKLPYNKKNLFTLCFAIIGIVCFIFVNTNFSARMSNLSVNAGVLQERFVYFEDASKHIIKHPLGSGINTFEYKQYNDQSAFYDVRFIHNSLLQTGYDSGFLGIIAFLLWAFYGAKIIISSSQKHRLLYLFLYSIIYIHSLLDFDFSYIPVLILLTLIVVICNEDKNIVLFKTNYYIMAPVLALGLYVTIVNINYSIGDTFLSFGKFDIAKKFYGINSSIAIKDPDAYSKTAQCFNEEYKATKKLSCLQDSLNNLMIANKISPDDPRIIGNIAFTYQTMGKSKDSIKYYDIFLKTTPYYLDMYSLYYSYLKDSYSKTKDSFYNEKINSLIEYYKKNQGNLNPKAKYMKNQITKNYKEIFK